MVDQDLPHQPGSNAEEMGSPFPRNTLAFDHPEEGFVDQRARLHGMAGPLAAQVASGELLQFVVDLRQKAIEGRLIAASPLDQKVGELSAWTGSHQVRRRFPRDTLLPPRTQPADPVYAMVSRTYQQGDL